MKLKITEAQLRMCLNKTLTEQAFNDEGEPLMTHSQYRDYSEPAEDDYNDNQPDYEPEDTGISALKRYLHDRDIPLETYGHNEYFIRSKDNKDYLIYPHGDDVDVIISSSEGNEEFKHLDSVKAIRLLLKFKEHFLSIEEADKETMHELEIDAQDRRNNAMERGMWEGEEEEIDEQGFTSVRKDYDDMLDNKYFNKTSHSDLREQGLGDYPAGAEHDSNAPWNQKDSNYEDSLEDIEIGEDNYAEEFDEVLVVFKNQRGGEAEMTLEELLGTLKPGKDVMDYFKKYIKVHPRPENWNAKIRTIAEIYANSFGLDYMGGRDYEEPDEWDNADDYRDER